MAAYSFGPVFGINMYKIGRDGTLTARWTQSKDGGKLFTEVARGTPGKLEGNYTMQGQANDGSGGNYSGSMRIDRYGDTYYVGWNVNGTTNFYGIGLRHGDWLAVGWSTAEKGFGVIDYKLDGDTAQGRWALMGSQQLSFEMLERERQ